MRMRELRRPAKRPASIVRPEGWLAHPLDRLAEFSEGVRVRWHRFTDGIPIPRGRGRFVERFRVRWYRFTDGIPIPRGRGRLVERFRVRWYRFTDGIFTDGIPLGRTRLADRSNGRSGHGVLSGTQTLMAASLSVMLVAAVVTLIRAAGGTQPASTEAASTGPTEAAPPGIDAPAGQEVLDAGNRRPGLKAHVNGQAGYRFSFPDSWELSRSEETARLVSPDGGVVMVFGVAPHGPLEEASDRVVESLTSTYGNAELVTGGIERTPGGFRFLMVGGKAPHATRAPIRFLAITIQGPDENQAITVHFSADSDPLEALPAIRRIIASYETSVG
jgi:hypothetical protein